MRGADALTAFEAQEMQPQPTPEPQDAPARSAILPAFPVDVLPDQVRRYALALAEAQQIPVDMAVGGMLCVASAAGTGRIEIKPYDESDYREAIQLFALVQGLSGDRKSSTLKTLEKPLRGCIQAKEKDVSQHNAPILHQLEDLETAIKREKTPQRREAMKKQRDELRESLVSEPAPICGDVTPESIVGGMAAHDGQFILLYGEGNFLNVLTGASYGNQSGTVNLDPILDSYGNTSLSGMRAKDQRQWNIPRASMSIGLFVQPGLLHDFMADSKGRQRGLQARFLFFLTKSRIGQRKARPTPVPAGLSQWWEDVIRYIYDCGRPEEPLVIPFTQEAAEAYEAFFNRMEPRRADDLSGDLLPWAARIEGNTTRIAALLALLERNPCVTMAHWQSAQAIMEGYLIPHARSAFLGEDPRLGEDARRLWGLVQGLATFNQSDLWQDKARRQFDRSRERYQTALAQLQEAGYICMPEALQTPYSGKGQRPSPVWQVLHAREE